MTARPTPAPRRRSFATPLALALVGAFAAGAAGPARADGKSECLLAYENAQLLRRKGNARGARTAARQCARAECSEVLRRDCVAWAPEIEKEIPTVIFRARLGSQDLSAVRVSVDGEFAADQLDGRGVEVDAGEHTFTFEAAGRPPREARALVAVGEKNRIIGVSFDEPAASGGPGPGAPPAPEGEAPLVQGPMRVGAVVAAGVGLVGLGVGLGFGLDARSKRDKANELCTEDACREPRGLDLTDKARSSAAVSTAAFAIGGAGLAAGVGLWLLSPKPGAKAASSSSRPSLSISFGPAGAKLTGAFQ